MPAPGARAPLKPFLRAGSRDPLRGSEAVAKKPVLVFDSVQKVYRQPSGADLHVLRGVDLGIERGEFVFVTGPSGAGKSTILKLLAGVVTPTRGRVAVSGKLQALIELGAGFHPDARQIVVQLMDPSGQATDEFRLSPEKIIAAKDPSKLIADSEIIADRENKTTI